MTAIDSLKLDSTLKSINGRLDCLSHNVEKISVSHNYFSDILSHQWQLLSIQTGIFSCFILVLVGLLVLVNWNFLWRPLKNLSEDYEKTKRLYQEKFDEYEKKFEKIRGSALRALYEAQTTSLKWRIIHHTRYCEWFYDNKEIGGLRERLRELQKEMLKLEKEYQDDFKWLIHQFGNKWELVNILTRFTQSTDSEIQAISNQLLKMLKQ